LPKIMIIFLFGQDTYRSRQKLNGMIEQHKKIRKSGLNLKYYDLKKQSFEDFKSEFQQMPMFEEKKLMVLENSFSNPDFKEKFLKDSKRFMSSENIVLFYEQDKILKTDSLFKFLTLKKNAESEGFEPLNGQQLKNWAKKEFEASKCKIGEKDLEKLIEFIGSDLWQFSNEIKKLAAFKPEIKDEDVELLVKPKIETDIFKTIDFLAARNKKKALELIKKHLENGDHPGYLLSMINYQFRNLLMVKDLIEKNIPYYLILKKTQLKPFVVNKSYQQAGKFSLPELKKIYQKIFQADLDIKTGKINPEIALDLLITEI